MSRHLCLFVVLAAGCAHPVTTRDATNAVLWVQTAAEYEIAVQQSFLLASRRLEEALAQSPSSPAIVMDLDETVLDNSAFEARLIAQDVEFGIEDWYRWLEGTEARAMPGAVGFVDEARRLGVTVYFVTNRHERFREPTLQTLRKVGLVAADDDGRQLWMRDQRPGWTSDKSSRRDEVARSHALLMLVGDDLNDFVSAVGLAPEARRALVAQNRERFGRDWILIPSVTFGSWWESLHDYREDLSGDERRALHLKRLRLD